VAADGPETSNDDAMFRVVVETSPYLYAVIAEDLSLRYVNPAVLVILGYEPEALVGRSAADIIHPDDFEVALGALVEIVAEYGERPEGGVPMPVRLISRDDCSASARAQSLGAVSFSSMAAPSTVATARPAARATVASSVGVPPTHTA